MNNRVPIFILAVLVLVALVWRIANPPPPPMPGPLGRPPAWDSRTKIGDMNASAMSPSDTVWAGSWNAKNKDGKLRSALLVLNLEEIIPIHEQIKGDSFVTSLAWKDDNTVRALVVDSDDPAAVKKSELVTFGPVSSDKREIQAAPLKETVLRILAWPAGSDKFAAQLAGTGGKTKVAVLSESGEIVGKAAEIDMPAGSSFAHPAAISPDGSLFVFSVAEDKVGGRDTFYLVDAKAGTAKKAFSSADLLGRVEGLWVSPAGILIVCAEREKFARLVYAPAGGKLVDAAKSGIDVKKAWSSAPASMMFVTYNGGYDFGLADGKSKRLFDLTKQSRYSDSWRRQIQDGRLYPRKDGDYTSMSLIANEVDIRVIKKDGDLGERILPRG